MGLLLPYYIDPKERCTDLWDMRVRLPALIVDIPGAPVTLGLRNVECPYNFGNGMSHLSGIMLVGTPVDHIGHTTYTAVGVPKQSPEVTPPQNQPSHGYGYVSV